MVEAVWVMKRKVGAESEGGSKEFSTETKDPVMLIHRGFASVIISSRTALSSVCVSSLSVEPGEIY